MVVKKEFMGKIVEDHLRLVLVTLSEERDRLRKLPIRTSNPDRLIPPWLESSIYQLEMALVHVEGTRLAARTLKSTVEEILRILKDEDRMSGRIAKILPMIRKRFEALLRGR